MEQKLLKVSNKEALENLKKMIQIPSFSGEEKLVCDYWEEQIQKNNFNYKRKFNNLIIYSNSFNSNNKSIILNSHLDTVKPNNKYQIDPFEALEKEGKLYGLGSNDAGISVVCLYEIFKLHQDKNLILILSSEEENGGEKGIRSIINELKNVSLVIVGEPTNNQIAIGERGLMVADIEFEGKSAHVSHQKYGINAIEKASKVIPYIKTLSTELIDGELGKTEINITQISGGKQHNIIPDLCTLTLDIRFNEKYDHNLLKTELEKVIDGRIKLRSDKIKPKYINKDHKIFKIANELGLETYISNTCSDMAHFPFNSVKCGPGLTERSHIADEFIEVHEIEKGILNYHQLLNKIYE